MIDIPGLRIVSEIGAGGFAKVYRARQEAVGNREVAVKVMDVRNPSEDVYRRFERECDALGKLAGHPNIVSVFFAGITVDNGKKPYIVMKYLPKGSLADRGKLRWEEVTEIGVKLAGALQSAHDENLLHRDIKPQNVLVDQAGEPKLADFGIAVLEEEAKHTKLVGTPGYMAPELFYGDPHTRSADIYSLGATLFCLLAGHPPFRQPADQHKNPTTRNKQTRGDKVPNLRPEVPDRLCAVLERAMAKRPEDRFQSAAALKDALKKVPPVLSPPFRLLRKWLRPKPVIVCSLVLVAAFFVSYLWLRPDEQWKCPLAARADTGDTVLSFGVLYPQTGPLATQGPAHRDSAELALADIVAAGGIPAFNVNPDPFVQDEGNPSADKSCQSTDTLLSNDVDVIIGPAASAVSEKVIDKIAGAGVILFSPSNTSAVLSNYDDRGRYFRTAPSDVNQGRALGRLVVRDGNRTVVVMARNDAYGNALREATANAITAAGGQVLASLPYDPDAQRYDRDVQRIKASDPQAIVLIGFSADSARILATMITQGVGPKDKPVYGADGNMSPTLPSQVAPSDLGALAGMKGTSPAENEAFSMQLQASSPGIQDVTYAAQTYDAVVVTALAAAVARSDAPSRIAEEINGVTKTGAKCTDFKGCMTLVQTGQDIDYDGLSGPLELTEAGEPNVACYTIKQFQGNGGLAALPNEPPTCA